MSCGGHDGVTGPYAGYACYYRKTTSGGTTNVSNEGRSLKTCDAVATPKWDYFGSEYQIGLESNIFANPVACCCR